MQEKTEFLLIITMIGHDIPKKLILSKIWPLFGPSLAQILSKIGDPESAS